jgi:hypothetical protein
MVSSVKSALTLFPFRTVAQHESDTSRYLSWSVTVYDKNVFSQCDLTAKIEPVQANPIVQVHYMLNFFYVYLLKRNFHGMILRNLQNCHKREK